MKHRPIRIMGEIAVIDLNQGYQAIIDAADVHLVDGHNWTSQKSQWCVYAYRKTKRIEGKQGKIYLHQFILKADQVDHIDLDGLNNRRENLRPATNAQNAQNKGKRADNTSGYKGVCWSNSHQKWKTEIQSQGKRKHLGYFSNPEDAYARYCHAAICLHGEFARTE